MSHLFDFFVDPVLRGPTWGTLFLCIGCSLIGVILFFRRNILIGESLSHAAYPGVVFGVLGFALFSSFDPTWVVFAVLAGAFVSALCGLKAIRWMENRARVRSDAALCFVLAIFFAIGTVAMSFIQWKMPVWSKQVHVLLLGQAATMTDLHAKIFAPFTCLIV